MPQFEVKDGRLLTWSLETHIVDHCNLACKHCCTLSPELDERAVDVGALRRDLEHVESAVQPNLFKITGGEPLLHPDVVGCLEAVRDVDIADSVQVTTNGHLIKRAPDRFWDLVDRLVVSYYTSAPLAEPLQNYIEERSADHDVELEVRYRDSFLVMDVGPPPQDDETTQRVYDECWLKVRCHMIYDGYYYKCTRPPHLADRLAEDNVELNALEDGVELAGGRLAHRLRDYLESETPIESCRYCRGCSGEVVEHEQRS